MTVAELIRALQVMPSDAPVVVSGYEGGYDVVGSIQPIQLVWNYYDEFDWIYGRHADATIYQGTDKRGAVLISEREEIA